MISIMNPSVNWKKQLKLSLNTGEAINKGR